MITHLPRCDAIRWNPITFLRLPRNYYLLPLSWSFALLLAGPLSGAQTTTPKQVFLHDSVKDVPVAPQVGPMNPHRPFISRRTLRADESEAEMVFEVALRMRNFSELQQRIGRGELISPSEMAAKYDPLPADYRTVSDWIASQGFKIVRQDDNRLAIFVRAKVSQVRQALQVDFARVTLEGKDYTSVVTVPSVPSTVSPLLVGINGLQPHIQARPHFVQRQLHPNSLTGTNAPYLPSQIAKAYQANGLYTSNITGTGQSIAIVIDTFPAKSDLTSFWATYGVNQSINNIQFIQVVSGILPATSGEETLDVEWSSSIAPAAQVRVYATTGLGFSDLDQAYQQVYVDATTNPALGIHQLSMSYGIGEIYTSLSQCQTDAQYFANLASAGVTLFASSGDVGNDPDSQGNPGGPVQAESPASDPSVTSVGGTSMTLNSSGNVSSEVVWNNSSGASGGGTSIYFTRPPWQTGNGMPGGTARAVPDVSCDADPNTGAVLIYNGSPIVVGGTSWSSPTWAGFCALMNQARANVNLPSLGLLGPQIYPLLGTTNFRDITSGSNGFSAGPGYDLATGIGVPNVQTLTQTLMGVQTLPAVQTISPGQNATFTVASSGSPVSYQWQRMPIGTSTWSNLSDNGAYGGSTTASLTINAATTAMSGDRFQCVVGAVTSAPPSVLVVDTPLIISTLAGQVGVTGSQNGTGTTPGTGAEFNYPSGIAVDSSGNLYIADYSNDTIRMATPAGVVTTPYGQAGVPGSTNIGVGRFRTPNAIAVDGSNNLYVADSGNDTIRKITPAGVISTLAGAAGHAGSTDAPSGPGSSARFNNPQGIAVDGSGNVYVADSGNNTIRKITPAGAVTTLAGLAGTAGYLDATGTAAKFNVPISVAADSSGNVYVADLFNDVIRKVVISTGAVTTPYGQLETAGRADGVGNQALFNAPIGLAMDGANNLYVTDSQTPPATGSTSSGNNLLRRITPAGVVSTIAGQAGITGHGDGMGNSAQFYSLQAAAINAATGTLYLADTFNQTIRAGVAAPIVSVAATQPTAMVYGPVPGQFTVTRTSGTTAGLAVNYSLAGTAASGSDYTALTGTVTIPAGASSAAIAVNPLFNSQASANRSLQLTLNSSASYLVGSPGAATVTITEPTPYQAWKLNEFGSNAYVANIGGDLADPNHNGVPNLLEYAFNSNPIVDGSNPLPTESMVQSSGNSYLAITYTQLNNDPSLTYTVQVTSDLTQQTDQWHSGPAYTTVASQQVNGNTTQVTVRDNTPISQAPKRFIRVQVTGP
jgi:kumamolisin